ncbi:TPA: ABC transporter ATP-binding protein [Streptococcus equi subsp. zooepidemicus]|uniref:Putative hemin import ATP-binding protein HrtA n=1 Tax=Streptococcus equi subsp. zooepidemicus TaxID=40041 RepID=A0A7Z8ZV61_STRSZ|nr:ABC transporter ATP-binding protein [Streptococcus equi]KIS11549.1 ABC transporter ATP-binding protein [Streptococcus equi subsp. zooepidemicus Sz57]MCD3383802.1 ABC transporter ATP-binding protein [Streptococcus equi subsp. zooepidemicus]MCD3386812.1 ABC transporter ATP-binding protein [Streptococcus equi subsp. zooepidemicus]MCD3392694.1 ABC transporter ATP-binding protein [Streptococcus equi subsp. zooepidemicus]MCD3417711.1 ABC transporter ATP-binding protein [Streptococcus equi subsp. 
MTVLAFKQVTKSFKDGDQTIEALKKTDFSIEAGEFVALIGPSGSGKSTFLTIAGGLQTPSSGQFLVNGKDYTNLSEKERSKLRFKDIGFILQASNLIPFLTVKQQLELVDKLTKHKQEAKRQQLFEDLGIAKLANKLPQDLSGGERQRVAIARALYHDPVIILADEPTASLDTEKAFEVVELLAKESKEKNKAIIMVTHDNRMIDYCDKVYRMQDGQLSQDNHHIASNAAMTQN